MTAQLTARGGGRLRVLYLTHHSPWPPVSGGRVRDAALVSLLARRAELEVWAVSRTPAEDRAALRSAPTCVPVRIFPDESARRPFPARESRSARQLLACRAEAGAFDVVHVEGHYLFHLLPEGLRARAVVVEHNVESHLLRQRAAVDGAHISRGDLAALADAERAVWGDSPVVVALSPEDLQRIRHRVPSARVVVVPNGSDHVPARPLTAAREPSARPPRACFLANYAYPPNQDAVRWLLDAILPRIRRRVPGLELVLAGANLPRGLDPAALPAGVIPLGWVGELSRLWNSVDAVLCPLRIGGGVKVKVTDAVRGGNAVVSTSVGVEGLPRRVRGAIQVADGTDAFTAAAVRLIEDPVFRRECQARVVAARGDLPTWEQAAAALHRQWGAVAGR